MSSVKRLVLSIAILGTAGGCTDRGASEAKLGQGAFPAGALAKVESPAASAKPSLADARRTFETKLGRPQPPGDAVPEPPPGLFRLVKFPSKVGDLSAYLTPDPADGRKRPAIIWITGGDCNSIGEVWEPAPRENDQTASAYRKAGIVMMFPSLRGGNDNPGRREGFLGEVDDVLSAADFLAAQPYVDPTRIYLGGHSTGGTLAMLAAETSDRFRATFAFGPVDDVRGYGGNFVYHQPGNDNESLVRSPVYWLDSVRSPLYVIEGTDGNIEALESMRKANRNPHVRFAAVPDVDHFGVLAPANAAIAPKILADTGPTAGITLSESELKGQAE